MPTIDQGPGPANADLCGSATHYRGKVRFHVARPLKSGKLDIVEMSPTEALRFAASIVDAVRYTMGNNVGS